MTPKSQASGHMRMKPPTMDRTMTKVSDMRCLALDGGHSVYGLRNKFNFFL